MKLGIRTKLVILLTTVALLPLAAAVITIAIGLEHLRLQSTGESFLALARAEALARELVLVKDIEKFHAAMHAQEVLSTLEAQTIKLPQAKLDELDRRWPTMPLTSPEMSAVLHNPIAAMIREMMADDRRIKEVLVADKFGQLVAASGRSEDYFQGDEAWWTQTYSQGKGRIFIPDVHWDVSSNAYTIDVCLPLRRHGTVLGVLKAEIDVTPWMEIIGTGDGSSSAGFKTSAYANADLMLAGDKGVIIYRRGQTPLSGTMADWDVDLATGANDWRVRGGEVQAFAPVRLRTVLGGAPVFMPRWQLVMYTPESSLLAPIYRIGGLMLGVGLVFIVGLFLLGLWLIERSIVRRILDLQDATLKVAHGDLAQRVPLRRRAIRLSGPDEIDHLAQSFNQMIDNVQRSTQALETANELKTNFIRVAGHELRTPVSYILGMARLLKDSTDAAKLLFAVQSMGAKAKRLNEIIQAMFKLMPELGGLEMRYSQVVLSELLEEIYVEVFPFAEQRDQRLIIEELDRLPPLRADRDKLRDVLENLIMNAIKFTPDGGIIKVRGMQQLGAHLAVSVQDQGPGIPESEYPRLFQPFYSGRDVMTHSSGEGGYQKRGMGLGLAIVRHFVEMHNGSVHVASSPLGTTFTVSLPIEPIEVKSPGRPQEPSASDDSVQI